MDTAATHGTENEAKLWEGGGSPFKVSYGKVMMWYFLISDTFIFAGFLISYGAIRSASSFWPDPNVVFSAAPFHIHLPLLFVTFMTFTLIVSSVTMVRAVQEGHAGNKAGVQKWLAWTILGGLVFLGSQAWEWTHLIHEGMTFSGNHFGPDGTAGPVAFGQFFFLITGFHGTHVTIGVIINTIVLLQVRKGVMERRGHYEMVEKVGLYWHFVDLVWVFVFMCYYLL